MRQTSSVALDHRPPIVCFIACLLAGTLLCGTSQAQTVDSFDLAVGASRQVGQDPLTITFIGVSEDSRCPSDVICVWGGDALVSLLVQAGQDPAQDIVLHTYSFPPDGIFDEAIVAGYTIWMEELAPYPVQAEGPIDPGSYVVSLQVTIPDTAEGTLRSMSGFKTSAVHEQD